jgi:multidrug efflux pump subunit AcrA (membrane-fusion protein)
MPENQEIEIRSDEVQEILSHVPSWMIRWGITLIFALIVMVLVMSWIVKYPDAIPANAYITTETPPLRLVNKTGGQLVQLNFKDGANVQQGDIIALMENPVPEDAVSTIQAHLSEIEDALAAQKIAKFVTNVVRT